MMGAKTGIEWTDATWNPIRGCMSYVGKKNAGALLDRGVEAISGGER